MTNPDATIAYYDEHGLDFAAATEPIDMVPLYEMFLPHIPRGGHILDAGCGSGRDTKAFLDAGYRVTPIDASKTMVEAAGCLAGVPARLMRFQELDLQDTFDGIWACATLLHVPRQELDDVLARFERAVRPAGVIYVSFKHGDGDRVSKGRHFTDFTPKSLTEWVDRLPRLKLTSLWETGDRRSDRKDELWVNALLASSRD